jgi:hypothetical protein
MATSGFCQYTFIIFNNTGYSLQYLNCHVLISPEFMVICSFLGNPILLLLDSAPFVSLHCTLYRNVPTYFKYVILLLLIIFWYAVSSFICSHLLSKTYSFHLCVSLHFSNVWTTFSSPLSWGFLPSSTPLLLLRSFHIFNQKRANLMSFISVFYHKIF